MGPSARRILLGIFGNFNDSTLTIDNPNDIDWYKFRVGLDVLFPQDTMLTIHAKSRPFTAVDPSDIDMYVFDSATFTQRAASTNLGSTEALTFRVVPGVSYYLGVIDAAAEPTRYSICMQRGAPGVTCTPQGSALQASMASAVYRVPVRAADVPAAVQRAMQSLRALKRP